MTDQLDPTRVRRTWPDISGKKVCKTCDFANKVHHFDHTHWQCQAPQNRVPGNLIHPVSGDWHYIELLCNDVQDFMQSTYPDGCQWYQIDAYITVNGIRYVDKLRALDKSSERITNADLKKLTLDDIL